MNKSIRIIITLAVSVLCVSANTIAQPAPEVISDQYYYAGPEGNLGLRIGAKYRTLDNLADALNLKKVIAGPCFNKKRDWILADILVSIDFNANGNVATWKVSGPKPLIQKYLDELEKEYKTRKTIYDFGYAEINYKTTAYWESNGE